MSNNSVLKIAHLTLGLSLLVFLPFVLLHAQTETTETEEGFLPENTVSCFDYYTFGSVQAYLTTSLSQTVSGVPITFDGVLQNENSYPIVDGTLYVKIFRKRTADDANGPDVVDQFLVKTDINIPAYSSVPVSFSWKIPGYAKSGDYQLATFFTTSLKFNLSGLSFTDDVVGNTVPFTVIGENKNVVAFVKDRVLVNEEEYRFAAFPPRVSNGAPATVSAVINNPTKEIQKASVLWTVYQWDAQLRQNVVQEKTETVTVEPGGTARVSMTVTDKSFPVYLVVGELKWKDTKSIIGVRFVREGVDKMRINFPGVTTFPLRAGESTTLFSCLHNAGEAMIVPSGRLDLTLSDTQGNIIHEASYVGEVTGAMMGIADQFMPTKNYDRFTLDARLYTGETLVDEAHLVYDCEKISPGSCESSYGEDVEAGMFSDFLKNSPLSKNIVVIILALVVLLSLSWVVFKRKSYTPPVSM